MSPLQFPNSKMNFFLPFLLITATSGETPQNTYCMCRPTPSSCQAQIDQALAAFKEITTDTVYNQAYVAVKLWNSELDIENKEHVF